MSKNQNLKPSLDFEMLQELQLKSVAANQRVQSKYENRPAWINEPSKTQQQVKSELHKDPMVLQTVQKQLGLTPEYLKKTNDAIDQLTNKMRAEGMRVNKSNMARVYQTMDSATKIAVVSALKTGALISRVLDYVGKVGTTPQNPNMQLDPSHPMHPLNPNSELNMRLNAANLRFNPVVMEHYAAQIALEMQQLLNQGSNIQTNNLLTTEEDKAENDLHDEEVKTENFQTQLQANSTENDDDEDTSKVSTLVEAAKLISDVEIVSKKTIEKTAERSVEHEIASTIPKLMPSFAK